MKKEEVQDCINRLNKATLLMEDLATEVDVKKILHIFAQVLTAILRILGRLLMAETERAK